MADGWRCPTCGAVYAPWVRECSRHRPGLMPPAYPWVSPTIQPWPQYPVIRY